MMIRFNQRRDEPLVCQCNGSPLGCNRWYARHGALVYEAQFPFSRMEPPKRAVYQLKSSKIQERSEVDCERVTDRGKETCEWLGLFRWFWGESLWNVIRAFYSTRMHSQTICKASFRYILHGRIGHSG